MKLETIKNAVTSKAARQLLLARKNSPHLLFGAGVIGVAAGTVLACRATLKVDVHISDAQSKLKEIQHHEHVDYNEDDRKKDMAIVYVQTAMKICKLYGPSIIILGGSVAMLTSSHTILTRRNAGLTAAYAALEKGFNEYRKRVTDELGEEKDREFRYGYEACEVDTEDGKKTVVHRVKDGAPSIYARFFDEFSVNWSRRPEYNKIFLMAQQNYANDMLRARGHVFLNEIYDALGLERSSAGSVVGWVLDKGGDSYIDFGIFDGNKEKVRDFVNGREGSVLLDFNVDGVIYDKI
jgi:hypothetical protein